jgi:hypothetical protein
VRGRAGRIALEVTAVLAAAGLLIAWVTLAGNASVLYRGGLFAAGVAATVVIAAASHPDPGPLARALSIRPLCAMGAISYGVYLWHWPVICFLTPGRLDELGLSMPAPALMAARVAMTLLLAVASYRLVEQPIRAGAWTGWRIRSLAPAAVAVTVALVAWSTQGAAPAFGERGGGRNQLRIADTPIPPVTPGRDRLLVVGDSGAWSLQHSLDDATAQRAVDWVDRGTPACGVVPGDGRTRYSDGRVLTDPPGCEDWPVRWADDVETVQPDVALIFSVAPGGAARWVDGAWRGDCDPRYQARAEASYVSAIETLGADGARVAIATVAYHESPTDADGRYPEVDCRNETIRRAAAAAGAQVVDVAGWVCGDAPPCRETVETLDGRAVTFRPDGLHYDGTAGIVTARWLLDELGLTRPATGDP